MSTSDASLSERTCYKLSHCNSGFRHPAEQSDASRTKTTTTTWGQNRKSRLRMIWRRNLTIRTPLGSGQGQWKGHWEGQASGRVKITRENDATNAHMQAHRHPCAHSRLHKQTRAYIHTTHSRVHTWCTGTRLRKRERKTRATNSNSHFVYIFLLAPMYIYVMLFPAMTAFIVLQGKPIG